MNRKPPLEFLESLDQDVRDAFKDGAPYPDLTNALITHLYGNLYQRDQLNLRERLLVTIAVLMFSGNMQPQLATQTRIALKNGITRQDLMEVALQISAFGGFANSINAAYVVDSVADTIEDIP
jgi:4-carboxymuconolactone decarboxylase